MPSYTFICEDCKYTLELICSIKEYDSVCADLECQKCKSLNFYRDYLSDCVHTNVREVKTLGQLADRNEKKYGKELCQKMREDFKTKKKPSQMELPAGMSRASSYVDTPKISREELKQKFKKEKK